MSTHKHIDKLCAAVLVFCLLLTIAFMNGESLGLQPAAPALGYDSRLFDTERVHTIDIVMDDWEGFLETCENEEYAQCAVVIDGEAYKNTGIRAKGNTSLSMVSAMDSDRYSFKLEFDHYDSTRTYYGLDKLSLNNIIQDTTYMKDYLTYRLMGAFGVDAPLCSYVYITVNGEEWGLYLAVEGVEGAFLRRNYGNDPGALYKPDSMSFGGGRGNGQGFDMENLFNSEDSPAEAQVRFSNTYPEGSNPSDRPDSASLPSPPDGQRSAGGQDRPDNFRGGPGGGMGSDDVKLRYIDDDPESYPNIFQNAKTDITEKDQARLIAALKALDSGEDLENTLDVDAVLRYFVVHNFVCNGDSYTGSIVHNYYLYEENGRLSMIPWDYNLAYGTFQGSDASEAVNDPIDSPVSGGDSRPMLDWIFDSPEYTALYHQYFQEFLESADITGLIEHAAELIAPYVEKDPTQFYSYEEFQTGVETLRSFCQLRTESIRGQLDGSIPSTTADQAENSSNLVDASSITLSDMGTMNHVGGFGGGDGAPEAGGFHSGNRPQMSGGDGKENRDSSAPAPTPPEESSMEQPPSPPDQFTVGRSETNTGSQTVELLQQGPMGFPGEHRTPGDLGGGVLSPSGEIPGAANRGSLILAAASLAVLSVGIVFALLYRRRTH